MQAKKLLLSAITAAIMNASVVRANPDHGGIFTHPAPHSQQNSTAANTMPINIASQLMITDLSVVEDPLRTNPVNGASATWSFRYLIEQMAGKQNPSDFVMNWLNQWETAQTINGHTVAARASIREKIIDPWLQASGGSQLDLNLAPFKLLAIVNRMDLRQHTAEGEVSTAGEGRFVFGVLDEKGAPLAPTVGPASGGFTVIFEYELPAKNMQALRGWTKAWQSLENYQLGTENYNMALEAVTRGFTDHTASLGKPNGSPLNQIRSNEIALDTSWELREFVLDYASGNLRQHTVAVSPDPASLNGTPMLASLINANEDALIRGDFNLMPNWFAGAALAGPFTPDNFADWDQRTFTMHDLFQGLFFDIPWSANGINNNQARHNFALNTCNGCHREETNTGFVHIGFPQEHTLPGSMGVEAELSSFLTGTQVTDPVDGMTTREFAELNRRMQDFVELVESFKPHHGGKGPRQKHKPRFVH